MGVATSPPDQSSTPLPASAASTESVSGGILTYPIDMKDTQDRIKFTVLEIGKSSLSSPPKNLQISPKGFSSGYKPSTNLKTASSVFLPIQPSISDQNSTSWGEGRLNEIERRFVDASLDIMGGTNDLGKDLEKALGPIMNTIKRDPKLHNLGRLYLAEQAVGVQGLLSRATGSVLNPNLELLFQGPTLRPFNFSFKLSPRSEKEAKNVKQIIRFFKQNMAVRTDGDLFLRSPYAFGIQYQHGSKDVHKSLNRIKTCALQSCSVDYTPLGSYMTYEDSDATMVSYSISLQFQEIEPVYSGDYDEISSDEIGY